VDVVDPWSRSRPRAGAAVAGETRSPAVAEAPRPAVARSRFLARPAAWTRRPLVRALGACAAYPVLESAAIMRSRPLRPAGPADAPRRLRDRQARRRVSRRHRQPVRSGAARWLELRSAEPVLALAAPDESRPNVASRAGTCGGPWTRACRRTAKGSSIPTSKPVRSPHARTSIRAQVLLDFATLGRYPSGAASARTGSADLSFDPGRRSARSTGCR